MRSRRLVRPLRNVLGAVSRIRTSEPVVSLTFDDGPHPTYTPAILQVLEKHHARGTFFMVGEAAARYPYLVQEVASRGHAIGNHSWSHPSFREISWRECRRQVRACAQILERCTHKRPRIFRPPYGHQSTKAQLQLALSGYEVVVWSAHAEDWLASDCDLISEHLTNRIAPGKIVLLHDALRPPADESARDRGPLIEALSRTLCEFSGSFEFLTVPQLLSRGRPVRVTWHLPN